jgi:cation transport ATPase
MTDARLLIGGVSCAACTWLIETTLQAPPRCQEASLNLTQGRLDVRFDRGQLPISELFAGIAALGYRVQPWQTSAAAGVQARLDYQRDLRRLAVAGIGMMQVGMFAIALHAGRSRVSATSTSACCGCSASSSQALSCCFLRAAFSRAPGATCARARW